MPEMSEQRKRLLSELSKETSLPVSFFLTLSQFTAISDSADNDTTCRAIYLFLCNFVLPALLRAHAVSVDTKGDALEQNPDGRTRRKGLRNKPFPCPFCGHPVIHSLPTVCPHCNTGLPEDARTKQEIWPEKKIIAPDYYEGKDGRHIADN